MQTKKLLFNSAIALTLSAMLASCGDSTSLEDYVDPAIGGIGMNLNPTKQTVQLPNSMVRFAPSRYDITDEQVSCYPLSQGSHRLESFFGFLPLPADTPEEGIWGVKQTTDAEKVKPSLYSSRLEGCSIQMAPTARGGIINVSFIEDDGLIRLTTLCDKGGSFTDLGGGAFSGTENFNGMHSYVYAETVPPAKIVKTGDRGLVLSAGKNTVFRYALSYISPEQAKENFQREVPQTLDEAASEASKAWEERLGKIKVEGGTLAHRRSFYTALYRSSERMVNINEYGRYYSNYDHKVHESDRPFYVDNWTWDTHIALEPLYMIIEPEMEENKLQSYVEMYKQCGTMPSFAEVWGNWPAMVGNYAAVWMADAVSKGLSFDLKTAYEGLRAKSLERTLIPWRDGPQTALDKFYSEKGYFPSLRPGEKETEPLVDTGWERRQAVSVTTAYSYADWAIAQIADSLGLQEDKELFTKRASNWKNVFRTDKGHMWPKDAEGKWIEPYDPMYADRAWFTENNGYTFDWDVKHDLPGLFAAMGGKDKASEKLDSLFHTPINTIKPFFWYKLPDMSGLVGQFCMGNEPSFHIPYLYNYLDQPWKTQKLVHRLIDYYFTDTVLGVPGDEDGGGMSAFAVFTMAGFLQVTPGIPVYTIGSPFFEKVTVSLPSGKKFTIKAKNFSEDNPYIQGATLNGKPLERCWFTHDELTDGGELILVMGPEPNKKWGVESELNTAVFSPLEYEGNSAETPEGCYRNPILPGYYPDPSICRTGKDYWMVNSSFGYFPGLPVWHSTDLVHWEQCGSALQRNEDFFLGNNNIILGTFAPQISFNPGNGLYYIICTYVGGYGNFFITSADPASGRWSSPTLLPDVHGIDPSILFDTDGRAWITSTVSIELLGERKLYDGDSGIAMLEFDWKNGKTVGPRRVIARHGVHPEEKPQALEGPHLYHIGDRYYLMCAEGGTELGHSEVIFSSESLEEPFAPCPINPILTQRDVDGGFSCTGHADLVQSEAGNWYAVFLAVKLYEKPYSFNTGRQTCLLPVQWTDSQPVILPKGAVMQEFTPMTEEMKTLSSENKIKGFDSVHPGPLWSSDGLADFAMFIRNPVSETLADCGSPEEEFDLSESLVKGPFWEIGGDGKLELRAKPVRISSLGNPSGIFERITSETFTLETSLDFTPRRTLDGGVTEAGIVCYYNENRFMRFVKTLNEEGENVMVLEGVSDELGKSSFSEKLSGNEASGVLRLRLEVPSPTEYVFSISSDGKNFRRIGEPLDGRLIRNPDLWGFTGAFCGIFASIRDNSFGK